MVLAGVGVGVLFLFALTRKDEATAHLFDLMHWTLAYIAAAVVAWLGVRDATGVDRVVRAGTRTLRRAGGEFIEQCA